MSGCAVLASAAAGQLSHEPGQDYPLQPLPATAVKLTDRFWAPRLETNRCHTIAHNLREMDKQGTLGGFRFLSGDRSVKYHGYMWGDSDLYKTLEGVVYSLAQQPDPPLELRLNEILATIRGAQRDDGYLFPHLQITETNYVAFTEEGSRTCESYSIGHLIESAAEHYRLTGNTNYLMVATRAADLLVKVHAGRERLKTSGHPEIELALVKLYRVTGRQDYLDLAVSLVNNARINATAWSQGRPALGHDDVHGHCVAMLYLYAAATDITVLQNDQPLLQSLGRKWEHMVGRKLYLTGGVGHRGYGEGFGPDYELPNDANAYCETCAGIASVFWQWRLFLREGDARYIDLIERTLYNVIAAGSGLSGDRFFYVNPLGTDGNGKFNQGLASRFAWTGCPCCPANLVRFWPRLPEFIYATGPGELSVNLYVAHEAVVRRDGVLVRLRQDTDYPWDGHVLIEVSPERPATFALRLRIPGWARGKPVPSDLYHYLAASSGPVSLTLNGKKAEIQFEQGYAVIRRGWVAGDRVELTLPMPVERVLAHPRVGADLGKVAVERGPLVYCAEGVDNGGRAGDLVLKDSLVFQPERRRGWLNNPVVLVATNAPKPVVLVPYYAWNYRGEGPMAVWMPRAEAPRVPRSYDTSN